MNACACMGQMYDEPHCYCRMIALGLPLNESARSVEHERSIEQLNKLFGVGGEFYKISQDAK
jgi:hypothetical protein